MQSIFSVFVVDFYGWFFGSCRWADSRLLRSVVRTLAGLSFLLSLSSAPLIAVAADADVPSWDFVKAELQKRQARFDCVTIEFEEVVNWVDASKNSIKRNKQWKLQLKHNDRARVEERGDIDPRFNMAGERVTFGERLSITNGDFHASLMPNFGGEYTAGFIDVEDRANICSVVLTPLALCFRPLQWIENSDSPLQQSGDVEISRAQLGGAECIVVTWSYQHFITCVWFDPGRNYAPLQASVVKPSAKRELRWRIDYGDVSRPDIPTEWRFASLFDGTTARRGRSAKVLTYLSNDIPEKAFTIEFPLGTYITDRVRKQKYILLQGGRKREVKQEEWRPGRTFTDILEGGESIAEARFGYRGIGITCTIAVIVFLGYLKMVGVRGERAN